VKDRNSKRILIDNRPSRILTLLITW